MFRRLAFVILLLAFPARVRADDAPDVPFDPSIDECADPDAHCLPETPEPTDSELDAAEMAAPEDADPSTWVAAPDQITCPDGATVQDGRCVPDASATAEIEGRSEEHTSQPQ